VTVGGASLYTAPLELALDAKTRRVALAGVIRRRTVSRHLTGRSVSGARPLTIAQAGRCRRDANQKPDPSFSLYILYSAP